MVISIKKIQQMNDGRASTAQESFGSFSIGQGAFGKGSSEEYVGNVCEYALVYTAIASLPIDLYFNFTISLPTNLGIAWGFSCERLVYQGEIGDGWIWRIQSSEEIEDRHFDSSTSLYTNNLQFQIATTRHWRITNLRIGRGNLLREEEGYQRKRCFDPRRTSSMRLPPFPDILLFSLIWI